ncbi:MAG: hypothetical protein IMZ61_07845 [Planctomycetes bacterium]|nr:hypothetical protein [Planctomycetota bacterium]
MTIRLRNNMIKILLLIIIFSLAFTVMADELQKQTRPQTEPEESLPILDNPTWNQSQVQFTVISSAGGKDWATFGVAQNATAGFDSFWDEPEPPMPPFAPCVQAYFVYPENFVSKQNVSYLQSSSFLTWPLQISVDIYNVSNLTNVTITWAASAIAAIPSDYDVDLSMLNSTINMRQQQTYTFSAITGSYNGSITAWIDATPPTISQVTAIPESQMPDNHVNISATVTDYVGINKVALLLVYPDNSTENVSLTQNKIGNTYFCNRTYHQVGGYAYSIWAEDNRGNTNTSSFYGFVITGIQYYLTINTNGTGFGTVQTSPVAPYDAGTNVTLWANASSNSTFTRWYGDLNGTTTPQTLTMNSNKTVTAQFTKKGPYTLTLNKNGTGYGTVQNSPTGPYYYDDQITVWANASTNSTFTRWYGDLNGTTSPQILTMNGNKTITARFTKKGPYTLTLNKNGTGYGTVQNSPTGPYYYDDQITVWANASTNSTFTRWYGDLNGTTSPQILTMNSNKTVTAQFTIQPSDTIPPVTTAALAGTMGQNDWYVSDVTVTLNATDPAAAFRIGGGGGKGPSGVNHTYYKIDSGLWNEYTTPFVISADGQHTVLYYSDDIAGNVETEKSVSFKIDQTAPTITLTEEQIDLFDVKFTAEVSDETSGIDRVEFTLDGVLQYNDTQSPYEWTWTGIGNYQVTATAFDFAGNSQSQSMSTPVEQIQGIKTVQLQIMRQLMEMGLRKQQLS